MEVKLTELQTAYLAGIVDGEGTISMTKERNLTGDRKLRFRVHLTVRNTSMDLVGWLVAFVGGQVNPTYPKSNRHKTSYRVWWPEKSAELIVKAILPYLAVKKTQAELFLRYREVQKWSYENRRSTRAKMKSIRVLRDWFFDEFRRLNAKGPLSVTTNTPEATTKSQDVAKIESELFSDEQRVIGDDAPPTTIH